MRIRIALAAAIAATYMITSFNVLPAAAQAATGATNQDNHHAIGSISTVLAAFRTGKLASSTDLAINALLWPKLISITTSVAPAAVAKAAVPEPATTPAAVATTTAAAVAPPSPPPPPPPPPPPTDATSTDTTDWQCIRIHESGDEYNDPARPSGAYGILEETWLSNGFTGWPYQATATVQNALALKLYSEYGWTPWSTRFACGLG